MIYQSTLSGPCVKFHSNSKEHYQFSNLYNTEVIVKKGSTLGADRDYVFPSAEHAYQCVQKVQSPWAHWEVGGKFANWNYVFGIMNEHGKYSITHWQKKNMIGILAKFVINHPKTFGVSLVLPDYEMSVSKERWFPIFHAKYKGDLKDMLLKTSATLVEHDRKAGARPSKWGGLVKDGVLYGNNTMGKLLTQYRDSIRPKGSKRDLEVVGHLTLEQSVDARFKKARLEGKVIDITDTLEEQIIANSAP